MEEYLDNLEKISLIPGISGNELYSGISREIFNTVKKINKDTKIDKYGNVISVLRSKDRNKEKRKIIIDAHIDEVGFLVSKKKMDKVKLVTIGDINIQNNNNSKAYIIGKEIEGKIFQDANDIIFKPKDEKNRNKIEEGDIISFNRCFFYNRSNIEATALDNRIGCICLIELIKKISPKDLEIIFTFTSGEETDSSNLGDIALKYNVDFGIIVDAAYAKPVSFGADNMSIPELGKGCAVQYIGKNFIINKTIVDKVEKRAKKDKISFQREIPLPNLGRTNFSKLQEKGITGCIINIPVKNQHEQISEANIYDLESANKLILSVIKMLEDRVL
jgi:endoglucanase